MKRIVCIVMALVILCTTCLTSCSLIDKFLGKDNGATNDNENGGNNTSGGNQNDSSGDSEKNDGVIENPPIPESEKLNITEKGYTFFCASSDPDVVESFSNFVYRVATATGKQPIVRESESNSNVVFGVDDYTAFGTNSVVERYEIKISDGKLYITASSAEALEFAKDRLLSYSTDNGIIISNKMNESNLFNIFDYRVGKITLYSSEDLGKINLLDEIKIDGETLIGFSPLQSSYSVKIYDEYPTISATAVNSTASVVVEQATADNSGVARISVSAGGTIKNYSVSFYKNDVSGVNSKIVIKGGAKGTISFVIDDGTESTASFMLNNILGKTGYENIVATFALITRKVATLNTTVNEDGEPIYVIDENGKYEYTEINGKFDFWRNILATGKADVVSHTQTHTYEGDNDSGGVFTYKKNDGTYASTAYLPIGNVTAELVASNQIVKDIKGEDESITFIIPGVGAPHSGYFSSIYMNTSEYLIARGTAGADKLISDYNSIVYLPEELTESVLRSVASYMVEHYLTDPTGSTTKSSSNAECLAAGIQNWTDFMDTAIASGGWASFCIHEIRPDNYTGGDHHIYESQAKALFSYANAYGEDAWIASYNDAAKYYMEWSKSTVSSKLYDNSRIDVELISEEMDERLNMALTVRVEIPDSWYGATYLGESLEILSDENGRFVYVELAPGESISIEVDGYVASFDEGITL